MRARADRWYREAFELDPQSHYARITYADWLLSAGRFDEALQVASRGTSLADRARSVLAGRDATVSRCAAPAARVGRKPMLAANARICAIALASS